MKLLIDTRNSAKIRVVLDGNGESFEEISEGNGRRPESVLVIIDRACKKANIRISDIDEIEVEQGPGSFTGLKVGVSVANALSFSLQKKVNGKKLGELVEPKYE